MFTFKILFILWPRSSCHFKPASVFYYLFSSVFYLLALCIQHPKEFAIFCMLSAVIGPASIIGWTNGCYVVPCLGNTNLSDSFGLKHSWRIKTQTVLEKVKLLDLILNNSM